MSSLTTGDALRTGEPRGRWVIAATVLGSSLVFLDTTVVNVALPAIGEDLGAELSGLQWVVTGYLLTLAALILVGGSLGDRYGRRRIFTIGVVWFALASLACGLAPGVTALIAARAFQGIGGALLTPGSLAILQASFASGERGRAIGAWSGLTGVASALGPLVGGALIDAFSWRAVFLLNVPIAVAVVAVTLRHVPESRDPSPAGDLDLAGAVLGVLGLAGITFVAIEVAEQGWSGLVVTAGVVGVVASAAFVVVEARRSAPMLPLEVFRSRAFAGANAVTFTVYAAFGGIFFILAIHLQNSLGYSPLEAGAALLPVTVLLLAGSPGAGASAERRGPRTLMTVGSAVIAGATVWLATVDPGDGYWTVVFPGVTAFGVGVALLVAPLTTTALGALDDRRAGLASGVNNAVARAARLIAVAALPAIAGLSGDDYTDPAALTAGYRTALSVMAGLAATGALLAAITIPRRATRS